MNFVHLSLLAGLAATAIPVLLHLLGNRQPQLIDFPALRFVREAQLEHRASWQLRHFLLLLLRILLLVVLVLALARPRVHSMAVGNIIGISGLSVLAALASLAAAVAWVSNRPRPVWMVSLMIAVLLWTGCVLWIWRTVANQPPLQQSDSSAPIAAVLIIDTSPSMTYLASNQTRLEAAKNMAMWLLERMPLDSHIGILSGAPLSSLALNPRAAASQVSLIQEPTQRVDIEARIRTALDLVNADDLERKEIYVLTDMNSSSWSKSQSDLLRLIELNPSRVLLQIVDVGTEEIRNWQLGDPVIDFASVPAGGDIVVRVPVSQQTTDNGSNQTISVELWQEDIDPRLPVLGEGSMKLPSSKVVSREVVQLTGSTTTEVNLTASNLKEGVHHFTIQIDKNDPLMLDNRRYLSVTAKRLQPTLIVAEDPEISRILQLITNPQDKPADDGQTEIAVIGYSQLPRSVLTRYSVIILYDPPLLTPSVVQSLKENVFDGKGLFIVLGPSFDLSGGNLDVLAASELLPGRKPRIISRQRNDRTVFWDPVATTHPIYQELGVIPSEIAWQLMPIFKSWIFDSPSNGVQVLAALSSGEAPLLTSHSIGRGQIFTLMTPIPEFEKSSASLWNEMWISEQYWWAFGIVQAIIRILNGVDQTPLVFSAGDSVRLANDSTQWPRRWDLYTPQEQRIALEASDGVLSVGTYSQPGVYRLRGTLGVPVTRGFSVNIPADDTKITRIGRQQLDAILGANNYWIARSEDEVETSVGQARFGSELYPLLMLFVAGLFLAEQVMSNRFYQLRLPKGMGGR
jgi:hypothetical protein